MGIATGRCRTEWVRGSAGKAGCVEGLGGDTQEGAAEPNNRRVCANNGRQRLAGSRASTCHIWVRTDSMGGTSAARAHSSAQADLQRQEGGSGAGAGRCVSALATAACLPFLAVMTTSPGPGAAGVRRMDDAHTGSWSMVGLLGGAATRMALAVCLSGRVSLMPQPGSAYRRQQCMGLPKHQHVCMRARTNACVRGYGHPHQHANSSKRKTAAVKYGKQLT